MRKLLLIAMTIVLVLSCKNDDDNDNNCNEPLSVGAGQVQSTSARISWDPGSETAFEVEYGLSGFATGTGTVMQTSQTSLFIDGLTPSTDYDAYVRSNCGSEGFSNYVQTSFTTLQPADPCNKPTNLFLITVSSTTIEFGWDENDETEWQIEYGLVGFPLGSGTIIDTSESNYEITGLQPGTTYEIYVRAFCGLTFSEYSDALVVTTDP